MEKFGDWNRKTKIAAIAVALILIAAVITAIAVPLALNGDKGGGIVPDYDLVKRTKKENFTYLNKTAYRGQVVLIGDSITEIYNSGDLFAAYTKETGRVVYNRGISGDTSDKLLWRLEKNALDIAPSHLVILIGTNDIAYRVDNEKINENVASMITLAKEKSPDTKIILQAVYPVNYGMSDAARNMVGRRNNETIGELNALLKKTAEEYGAAWLDLTEKLSDDKGDLKEEYCYDGLHLNARGFAVVTENLLPLLA